MENPFKHRVAETPSALSPEALAQATVATEAAVAEGLGTRPASETLDDAELVSAGFSTLEARDAIGREQTVLYENLVAICAETAEKELAALVAQKDTAGPEVRAAISDLEHTVQTQASLGMKGSPALNAILSFAEMTEFEDRTTGLFSAEVQQAIHRYRADTNLLAERRRVHAAEGTRVQEEINSRKEI